jgi:hypothetical protein
MVEILPDGQFNLIFGSFVAMLVEPHTILARVPMFPIVTLEKTSFNPPPMSREATYIPLCRTTQQGIANMLANMNSLM